MYNLFPDILNWYYLVLFIYVTITFILCMKEKTIRNIPLSKKKKNMITTELCYLTLFLNFLRQLRINSYYIQYCHSV